MSLGSGRPRPSIAAIEPARGRSLAGLAGYLTAWEAANVVTYAFDRVILGVLRSAATAGLCEGPIRLHNLLRTLTAGAGVTVLSSASRYFAEGDQRRLQELLVRGSRYVLALVVPLVITGAALGGPILEVWLGDGFERGATALAILLGYWLVSAPTGILTSILGATGRARDVARFGWAVAIANLALSVPLTAWLGLEGVALGTAIPFAVGFPYICSLALRACNVRARDLLREAFAPALTVGVLLAGCLIALRLAGAPETLAGVLGACVAGPLAFWIAYYLLVLSPSERGLVRSVARSASRRAARASV